MTNEVSFSELQFDFPCIFEKNEVPQIPKSEFGVAPLSRGWRKPAWYLTLYSHFWKKWIELRKGSSEQKSAFFEMRNISKIGNVILKIFMRAKNWSQAWCWSPSQHKEWNLVKIALDRQIQGVLKERQESALTEKFTHNEEFIDSLGKTRWNCDNSE